MHYSFRFLLLAFVILMSVSFTYSQSFDKLQFNSFPANWSKQLMDDRLQFSNYNLLNEEPVTVTMLKSSALAGKPDAGFKQIWRQYFSLPDTAATPTFKRLYNDDGEIMYWGHAEKEGPDGKGFYKLAVYYSEGIMQGIMLHAASIKTYKAKLLEWDTRLMEVSFSKKKK